MSDNVRAAAERLLAIHTYTTLTRSMDGHPICDEEEHPWPCEAVIVARAALEAGREVARLREALIGLSGGEDADPCWCPDSFFSLHEHSPECQEARAALSTPGEPESSGDDPEVARHEEILKEAWRFWASIQGDPVALDRGYRILRVHPDRYAAFDALFRPGARPMDQPAATPHDDARE
jgi:hypothetical protein